MCFTGVHCCSISLVALLFCGASACGQRAGGIKLRTKAEKYWRSERGELRLFDTKGHGYRSIGQRVVVSYEEQDSCGFFHQVDYIGRVVSVDPFDGLLVKFDVADASGDVLWVDDSDDWAWAV